MTEERLLDGTATDFEKALLNAAREEAPAAELSGKMLAPLAGGLAASAATGGASLAKLGAAGAGVALLGGAIMFSAASDDNTNSPEQTSEISAAPTVAQPPSTPDEQPSGIPAEVSAEKGETSKAVAPPPEAKPRQARGESPKSRSTLAAEMQLLDRARTALKVDDNPKEALRLLRLYQRKFPGGSLRPEATVLRVSALEESGSGDQATKLKEEFLQANPKSAHKKQLEGSEGKTD